MSVQEPSSNPESNLDPAKSTRVALAEPGQKRLAIALLLTGTPRPTEPAVDRMLDYAAEAELSLDWLWLAWRNDRPVAAALILPAAGRAAMAMISPLQGIHADLAAALVREACAAADRKRVRLVQALLDPWLGVERQVLERSGFKMVADLHYMERKTARGRNEKPLGVGFGVNAGGGASALTLAAMLGLDPGQEVTLWAPELRPLFAKAILASYEETLDCPDLVGMRDIDDIIDGHMAAGVFDPDLWMVVHRAGEPDAVMLLAPLPQRDAVELVYLGLSTAARGRGLARRLLTHGLALGQAKSCATMVLAVDEINKPAKKLYESLDFAVTARKLAMIMALA